MDAVAMAFEGVGAAILVAGAVWSAVGAVHAWRATGEATAGLLLLRRSFGAALLLGLEVLVAADLIRTVAVAPTLDNVAVLGLIVVIRTFLSFSLQVEIEGVMPWRRALIGGALRGPAGGTAGGTAGALRAGSAGPDDVPHHRHGA